MEDKAPIGIPVLIVFATIGILIFIFFIVFFVLFYQKKALQNKAVQEEKEKLHQRQLLNATIEIAEEERKRIANNLHDDIGAILNLVKLNIRKIERNADNETALKELSIESSNLLETTMENIRSISRDLAPPVLMKLGFEEGLLDLCKKINTSGASRITLTKSEVQPKFTNRVELQLYRIVQEVLNNIIKHASATEINLKLISFPNKFEVILVHNGKGINNEMVKELTEGSNGLGLKSIQSRVQIINANINYSTSNSLSSIIIETPFK